MKENFRITEVLSMPSETRRYAINCSILFQELPLERRPQAAADAGFEAIEFWWPFATAVPTDRAVDDFIGAVRDAGVELIGLNFAAGDMPAGDRGLLSWPGRETEFRDNVDVVVEIGSRLGCRAFNALYGNRLDGVSAGRQDDLAQDNLAFAATKLAKIDGCVLIEAVSGPQPYPVRTARDAIAIIDHATGGATNNIAFLADLYHLSVNGDDLDAVIAAYAPRIGHVQIADAPGRHEPGTGELDINRYLGLLDGAGYTGWVALEYLPTARTEDSFSWLGRSRRSNETVTTASGDGGVQ